MGVAFNPQAGAAAAVKVTGWIEFRDGAYFLTDETTNVTVQLMESPDVIKYVNVECDITGSSIPDSKPAGNASQLVSTVTVVPVKRRKAGAYIPGGTAAAHTGLSGTAIGAIIGGVAAGGVIAGLAAAGTFSGGGSLSTP
jgi:hypothetical protein